MLNLNELNLVQLACMIQATYMMILNNKTDFMTMKKEEFYRKPIYTQHMSDDDENNDNDCRSD